MLLIQILLFIVLQIAFLPLTVIGICVVGYKQIAVSKKLGISQTAIEIINGRWTMHLFGLREDYPTEDLLSVLPNSSKTWLWITLYPLWLVYKLTGRTFLYPRIPEQGNEAIADMVPVRTLYFDDIITRHIKDVDQFVVMGAGYDARAYGAFRRDDLEIFELDQREVQSHKLAMLKKAQIDHSHVKFVEVDFSTENAFDKLKAAGYDATLKTLFLWEGVSLYLTESDVRKMFSDFKLNSVEGSILLADFYGHRMLNLTKNVAVKKSLEYTDEGFGFGLPFDSNHEQALSKFINSESLNLEQACFLGQAHKQGPYMVVAEIKN